MNDDQIGDLLSELAGVDTQDTDLRHHPDAYAAVETALAPLLQDLATHEASNRIKTENLETLREQKAKLREALHSLEVSANTVGYCYDRRPENFASALSELSRQTGLARAPLGESE